MVRKARKTQGKSKCSRKHTARKTAKRRSTGGVAVPMDRVPTLI
jgi:hypothetical protein